MAEAAIVGLGHTRRHVLSVGVVPRDFRWRVRLQSVGGLGPILPEASGVAKKAKNQTRRRYSDDERAAALAALAANGGNLKLTAAQLGIPLATLAAWANGTRHPEASTSAEQKKPALAGMFRDFVGRVLSLTTDDDIRGASLKDRMTAAGIAVDKAQLLDGKATGIVKNDLSDLPDDELERRIKEAERKLSAADRGAGAAPGGTPEGPAESAG